MVEGQKIFLAMIAEEDLVARSSQGSPSFRTVIIIDLAAQDVAQHICDIAKTQNLVSTFNIIVLTDMPIVAADDDICCCLPDFCRVNPAMSAVKRHQEQRSEEHTSELQSLMRISYAVFCLKKNK